MIALLPYLFTLAIPVTLWFGFRYLRYFRLITGTPTALIRSAHQGYVEVIGHITNGEGHTLFAPLSGMQCVWYRYKVEDRHDRNQGKVREGESDNWFTVMDESGTCLVDPDGAEIRPDFTRTWYGETVYPQDEVAPGVRSNPLTSPIGDLSGPRYKYTEELLMVHEKVYLLGEFRSVGGGRHVESSNDLKKEVIQEWKQDYNTLLETFDTNQDGKIDMQEWAKVQEAAHKEALIRRDAQINAPSTHVFIKPRTKDNPYLISTLDEAELAKKYGWLSAACAVAFIIEIATIVTLGY